MIGPTGTDIQRATMMSGGRPGERADYAIVAIAAVLAWSWVGWGVEWGFPLDDAWIHQDVARTLVETGREAFSVDSHGGSTSQLWTFLLAGAHLVQLDPVISTRTLSLLVWLGAVLAFHSLIRSDGVPRTDAVSAASSMALCGNAVWFVWSGMEAVLLLSLCLTGVAAWRRGWQMLAAVTLGLAVLVRPEALVVAAIVACWAVIVARQSVRPWLIPCAMYLLAIVLNRITTASWLPGTLAGRRWLYGLEQTRSIADFISVLAQLVGHVWAFTAFGSRVMGCLLLIGVICGVLRLGRTRADGLKVAGLSALGIALAYAVVLPRIGHAGRYEVLLISLTLPLASLGLTWMARQAGSRPVWLASALAVPVLGIVTLSYWHGILLAGVSHINDSHGAVAGWARRHIPHTARIGAFDIGLIGWELPGSVVDLSGLSDPQDVGYLTTNRADVMIRRAEVDYVILPAAPRADFRTVLGITPDRMPLVEIYRAPTNLSTWEKAFPPTSHAWPQQALYRVASRAER